MKKNIFAVVLTVLICIFISSNIFAESTGFIEIKANVPENFEKSIMLNFFSEKSEHNALYTLNEANQYQLKEKIPEGKYRLDFVSIYGDNNNEFKIQSSTEIIITSNELASFPITITKTSNYKEPTGSINKDNVAKGAKDDNTPVENKNTDIQNPKPIWKELFSNTFTMICVVVLGIICLILKYRKVRYEHE